MDDRMFANQTTFGRGTRAMGQGTRNGSRQISARAPEKKAGAAVTDDSSLDSGIGAGGAPTSFINGKRVLGAVPFEQLKTIVDRQLGRSPRR